MDIEKQKGMYGVNPSQRYQIVKWFRTVQTNREVVNNIHSFLLSNLFCIIQHDRFIQSILLWYVMHVSWWMIDLKMKIEFLHLFKNRIWYQYKKHSWTYISPCELFLIKILSNSHPRPNLGVDFNCMW